MHLPKGLSLENNPCGDCKHFKTKQESLLINIPVCTKKLMSVVATLKVAYYTSEGSCFEPITSQPVTNHQ